MGQKPTRQMLIKTTLFKIFQIISALLRHDINAKYNGVFKCFNLEIRCFIIGRNSTPHHPVKLKPGMVSQVMVTLPCREGESNRKKKIVKG